MAWHKLRFTEDARKVAVTCKQCGRAMWLPPSKVAMYQRCGPECYAAARSERVAARTRPCETCGALFTPRAIQLAHGAGRFCKQACNTAGAEVARRPDLIERRRATRKASIASGHLTFRTGPDHHSWTGGEAARKERARTPEALARQAASLRAYRKANPDKVREFTQSRSRRQLGRLPRGTVKRIGEMQRWRCAICAVSVKRGYHVDHVTPLARGGEHAPRNLQLLCRTCNVRKNAKDPIDYMQSLGRLL